MSSVQNNNVEMSNGDNSYIKCIEYLCSMFENIDVPVILAVAKSNKCDIEKCIDELLALPTQSPQSQPSTSLSDVTRTANPLYFTENQLASINNNSFHIDENIEQKPLPSIDIKSDPLLRQKKIEEKKKKLEEKIQRRAHKQLTKKNQKQLKEISRREKKKPGSSTCLDIASQIEIEDELKPTILHRRYSTPIIRNIGCEIETQTFDFPSMNELSTEINSLVAFPPLPKINQPSNSVKSVGTDKPIQTEPEPLPLKSITSEREEELLRRIAELEEQNEKLKAENVRVETEKKNGMRWIIKQMDDLKIQLKSKDEEVTKLQEEIKRIALLLEESRTQENKLEKLLHHSKEVLFEGVQTLSKGVNKVSEKAEEGWVKIQSEVLNNENFNIIEKVKELEILAKMKEFAQNLKDELNELIFNDKQRSLKFFSSSSIPLQEVEEASSTATETETETDIVNINNNANVNSVEEEDLTNEEKEELQRAKFASLQSYVLG